MWKRACSRILVSVMAQRMRHRPLLSSSSNSPPLARRAPMGARSASKGRTSRRARSALTTATLQIRQQVKNLFLLQRIQQAGGHHRNVGDAHLLDAGARNLADLVGLGGVPSDAHGL